MLGVTSEQFAIGVGFICGVLTFGFVALGVTLLRVVDSIDLLTDSQYATAEKTVIRASEDTDSTPLPIGLNHPTPENYTTYLADKKERDKKAMKDPYRVWEDAFPTGVYKE